MPADDLTGAVAEHVLQLLVENQHLAGLVRRKDQAGRAVEDRHGQPAGFGQSEFLLVDLLALLGDLAFELGMLDGGENGLMQSRRAQRGFDQVIVTPPLIACTAISSWPWPVMMITGRKASRAWMRRRMLNPDMPGSE